MVKVSEHPAGRARWTVYAAAALGLALVLLLSLLRRRSLEGRTPSVSAHPTGRAAAQDAAGVASGAGAAAGPVTVRTRASRPPSAGEPDTRDQLLHRRSHLLGWLGAADLTPQQRGWWRALVSIAGTLPGLALLMVATLSATVASAETLRSPSPGLGLLVIGLSLLLTHLLVLLARASWTTPAAVTSPGPGWPARVWRAASALAYLPSLLLAALAGTWIAEGGPLPALTLAMAAATCTPVLIWPWIWPTPMWPERSGELSWGRQGFLSIALDAVIAARESAYLQDGPDPRSADGVPGLPSAI